VEEKHMDHETGGETGEIVLERFLSGFLGLKLNQL
jgi:hypothetical protein